MPAFAIGQRAILVPTRDGNVLWDAISLIDETTHKIVQGLGGLTAIAVSHRIITAAWLSGAAPLAAFRSICTRPTANG